MNAAAATSTRKSAVALAQELHAELETAVESFLAAHAASQEAWSNLTRAQISGPDPVPPQAEYLLDEARHRWDLLATGWAENLIPAEAREAGKDYARPKVVHAVVVQSGPCDWPQHRSAA